MARQEKIPSYPCMMQPGDLRRVDHPHEERTAARTSTLRRLLSRLVARFS